MNAAWCSEPWLVRLSEFFLWLPLSWEPKKKDANINVTESNTFSVLYNIYSSTVISLQNKHYIYIYLLYNWECLFVCLFALNAETTARIDAKRSEITKNDPESVLFGLKLLVLVFSKRYHDISGFYFAAVRHFYLSHFHFRLLPRCLSQSAFAKTASTVRRIATDSSIREPSHLERKCYC